jgi:hypothetical protein
VRLNREHRQKILKIGSGHSDVFNKCWLFLPTTILEMLHLTIKWFAKNGCEIASSEISPNK